jgi:hypothetical protein
MLSELLGVILLPIANDSDDTREWAGRYRDRGHKFGTRIMIWRPLHRLVSVGLAFRLSMAVSAALIG